MNRSDKPTTLRSVRDVTPNDIMNIVRELDPVHCQPDPLKVIVPEIFPVLQFRYKYLLSHILSKYTELDSASALSRRTAAIAKWLRVEQRNERTNIRLYGSETSFRGISSNEVLAFARRVISQMLGDVPHSLFGDFTNGASTSHRRSSVARYSKYAGQADVTAPAVAYVLPTFVGCTLGMSLNDKWLTPRVVEGNVLFTVPKNSDIDRVACKEPDWNLWGQKAVGDYIRRRLNRVGIDLNCQENNNLLAREASISGSHATIDLSSASDSLSHALISILLPPDWYEVLSALRSPITSIDGVPHENQMFSSMGNGFTFELETLVFYALARASCFYSGQSGRILVYGDDIVVPTRSSGLLICVLGFCGFTANPSKTFVKGPFRESCGGHWYEGYDVKPIYIRRPFTDVSDLIRALNQLRQWIDIHNEVLAECGLMPNPAVTRLWYRLARRIPKGLHGGRDTSRSDILVTPGLGSMMLSRAKRKIRIRGPLEAGKYLATLRFGYSETNTFTGYSPRNTFSANSTVGSITSSPSKSTDFEHFTWIETHEKVIRRRRTYWDSVAVKPSW